MPWGAVIQVWVDKDRRTRVKRLLELVLVSLRKWKFLVNKQEGDGQEKEEILYWTFCVQHVQNNCKSNLNVPLWCGRMCKWDSKYIFVTPGLPLQKICWTVQMLEGNIAACEGCWKTCLLRNSSAGLLVWQFVLLSLSSCTCTGFKRDCSSCHGASGEAPSHTEVNSKPVSLGM